MNLVLDSYGSGDVVEVFAKNRREYGKIVSGHLSKSDDNFVSVRGKDSSFIIEGRIDGLYNIYETSGVGVVALPLIEAIDYVFDRVQPKLI